MIYIDKDNKLNLSKLHKPQQEFIRSTKLHTGIIGGYQSGKSVAGTVKCVTKLLKNPKVPIAYYLPSYRLIEDMLVPKFKALFESIGIEYIQNKKDGFLDTPYGKIMMRSLDNPDSIVSYSVGYSLVDEFDVIPMKKMEHALGRINSRNSFKSKYGEKNSIDFVSTPEGYGFAYKFFVKNINDNKKLIKISTLDNEANLADTYIQGLREAYSEDQLKAYLNGDFVNLTSGTVYNEFSRKENHTDRDIRDNDVLHIGMDFNVTNMSAVIHVVDNGIMKAVEEVVRIYDTHSMCQALNERFPNHRKVIYPDASGKNRKTSGKSDVQILKEYGFKIKVLSKNPFVRDRVNIVNNAFRMERYYVNTNKCIELTESLEQLGYKGGEPDKTSGLDHLTDAMGYFIYSQNQNKRARILV